MVARGSGALSGFVDIVVEMKLVDRRNPTRSLTHHPLVRTYEAAGASEGGDGATIVTL